MLLSYKNLGPGSLGSIVSFISNPVHLIICSTSAFPLQPKLILSVFRFSVELVRRAPFVQEALDWIPDLSPLRTGLLVGGWRGWLPLPAEDPAGELARGSVCSS